jgi:hypothetical protein
MKVSIIVILLLAVISAKKVTWISESAIFKGKLNVDLEEESFTVSNSLEFTKTLAKDEITNYSVLDNERRGFTYKNTHIEIKGKQSAFEDLDSLLTVEKETNPVVTLIDDDYEFTGYLSVDLDEETFTCTSTKLTTWFGFDKKHIRSYYVLDNHVRGFLYNKKYISLKGKAGDFEDLDKLLSELDVVERDNEEDIGVSGLVENVTWRDEDGESVGELDIDIDGEEFTYTSNDNSVFRTLSKEKVSSYSIHENVRAIAYGNEKIVLKGDTNSFVDLDKMIGKDSDLIFLA